MNYGIYSRKSKFTGKGESIENQIELCKEYISQKFHDDKEIHIEVYEDEGFSGKNTARPEFQRMLSDIKRKRLQYVICYRLDRMSRSVGDFAKTIEDLERCGTEFICIKEQFDTSTPMGKAMMNIAAVFAQLERETIAERIRDNMMFLAKTGRWLGGTTPIGFESVQEEKISIDGKVRTSYRLSPVKQEIETVKLIYSKFLELESVTGVESFLLKHDIKTRRERSFVPLSIKDILSNPVYCVADKEMYHYFAQQGSIIGSDKNRFDGKHGISAYNRTSNQGKYQKKRDESEWIIAVGKHHGIIPSSEWLRAQKILYRNRMYQFKYNPHNKSSLLSGILYCKQCGAPMRPRVNSNRPKEADGTKPFYYMCELKRKSNREKCKSNNLPGKLLDWRICNQILRYEKNDSLIHTKVTELREHILKEGSSLQKQIAFTKARIEDAEREIEKLVIVLGENDKNSTPHVYAKKRIDILDAQIAQSKQDLSQLEDEESRTGNYNAQAKAVLEALTTFKATFNMARLSDKRELLHMIIERIEWDGQKIDVFLLGDWQERCS